MWKRERRKTKEKMYKEYDSNKMNLLKSSIFVILTLLVTILPFFALPANTAYAETIKKFKYTFDLGSENGVNYTYTIITQEKVTGEGGTTGDYIINNQCDVWIVDAYWTNQPENGNDALMESELGSKSLYNYMCALTNQFQTYYDDSPVIAGCVKVIKNLCYAGIEAGYTFTVQDDTNDEKVDKRYVYKSSDTQYTWGTFKIGHWFKANEYIPYNIALANPDTYQGHHVLEAVGNRKFAPTVTVAGPGMPGGSKFDSCFSNDQWLCWMITKGIEGGITGYIKSIKKEIEPESVGGKNGNYRYEILKDTMDKDNATIDVDVYRTSFSGNEKKIFTFRYTKGAKAGKQTPTIMYPFFNEKTGDMDNMTTGYYINSVSSGPDLSAGKLQVWPEVEDGNLVCGIDKRFKMVPGETIPYFNTPNCILEGAPVEEGYYNYNILTAAYVIAESNYCVVAYCPSPCDSVDIGYEPSSACKLKQDLDTLYTSVIGKAYVGIKIPNSVLDSFFPKDVKDPVGDQIDDGNWHLTKYNGNAYDVVAWNEPATDDEEQQYLIMQFGKGHFYKLYFDYLTNWTAARTGLYLSCRKRDENWNQSKYEYNWEKNKSSLAAFFEHANEPDTTFKNTYAPLLVASMEGDIPKSEIPNKTAADIQNAIVKDIAVTEGYKVYLTFYDSSASEHSQRGKDSGSEILVDKLLMKANGTPVMFDVTDWLREEYKEEIPEEKDEETERNLLGGTIWGGYLTLDELEENQLTFFKMLMRYSRPIIMFLIFLTICYTAIFSIMHNQDAGKRALVKERLKHITIGIILFAAVVGMLFLCKSLMDTSFEKIEEAAGATIINPFDTPEPEYKESWFVNLIIDLIEAVAGIVEWMVNSIMMAIVGQGSDLNSLIYNSSTDPESMTLSPFTPEEWNRYMYGYRALEALALALLAIAIIKFAAELIINASDSEKTAQAKETCLRVAVAMLAIILGPYAVRLLLTLFNYLITLIPLRSVDFDLGFADTGIIGAVANIMFVWMKFKIYLVFVVRKLMITFMLLITPVVFGLWAISNKFRSMSLWIGELFTNTATQFCYALVFFGASLIMYDQQSDFVSLILILMFMKLADFFKDSLQGLVQKWGGIDETKVAEGAINTGRNYLNKGIGMAKKGSNTVGSALIGSANQLDPDGVSDGGRRARNIGAILQGNIFGIEGKGTTAQNRANLLTKKAEKEQDKLSKTDKTVDTWAKHNNIQDLRRRKLAGEVLSPEEQQRLDFADHYLGVRSGNVSLQESKALAEANPENKMYQDAHAANVARSNRDIYSSAADKAQNDANAHSHAVSLDNWKVKQEEESRVTSRQTAEELNRTRDRLAEKTADLKATNMFDGNKNENKMLEQATNLMNDAKNFNEQAKESHTNNGINLDSIKQTISDTLSQCERMKNDDSYKALDQFVNTKDNVNGFGTPSNDTSAASTDAFEKKVNARIDTLKKSGVIK